MDIRLKAENAKYEKYGDKNSIVNERLENELTIIGFRQYGDIFLCLSTFVNMAKTKTKIFATGLINNLLTSYLLGITELNPLDMHILCNDCKNYTPITDKEPFEKCGHDCYYFIYDKNCSNCNSKDITFEGFDLNSDLFFHCYKGKPVNVSFLIEKGFKEELEILISSLIKSFGLTKDDLAIDFIEKKGLNLLNALEKKTNVSINSIKPGMVNICKSQPKDFQLNLLDNQLKYLDILNNIYPLSFSDLAIADAILEGSKLWPKDNYYSIEFGKTIFTQDGCYQYLIDHCMDKEQAFEITDNIMTGFGFDEMDKLIKFKKDYDLEDWFIKEMKSVIYLPIKANCYINAWISYLLVFYKTNYSDEYNRERENLC